MNAREIAKTILEDWLGPDGWPQLSSTSLLADFEHALHHANRLGQEQMREKAALLIDQCNQEGPYNAIGAAECIRALPLSTPEV